MSNLISKIAMLGAAVLLLGLQSCVRDNCSGQEIAYMSYEPVYMSESEFLSAIQLNAPQDLKNPGKIYIYQDYLLVNELAQGVHIYDNTDPNNPTQIAFLAAPGNYDIAVSCDKLYLDSSTDLLVFDFTNPTRPELLNRIENTFPHHLTYRGFTADPDKGKVISWTKEMKQEAFDCNAPLPGFVENNIFRGGMQEDVINNFNAQSTSSRTAAPTTSGVAGSTARFATVGNSLYVLSPKEIKVYDIQNCTAPTLTNTVTMNLWGGDAETLFPEGDRLFVGATTGMFIFDNQDPMLPQELGSLQHGTGCDPVVAQDNYAYVTLRSTNADGPCPGWTNQLEVVDITNPRSPLSATVVTMDGPQGLSIDGNMLFVCDGTSGLRVLDVADPTNPKQKARFSDVQATDVIAFDGRLIMVGEDGLAMYSYDQDFNIEQKGLIPVVK
ncbi:MAG: LVIVD repeat-containing protein [Bacteroidia bacterium]